MKSILRIITAGAAVVLMGIPAFGQAPGLCLPDCYNDPFQPEQETVITLPSGCVLRVRYATREACNTYYDLGIVEYEKVSGDCSGGPDVLLDEIAEAIFKLNPMGWEPGLPLSQDSCWTYWRVTTSTCWWDSVNACGDTLALPCDTADCCLSSFEVCADSGATYISSVTKTGAYSQSDSCESSDPRCVFVCSGPESTPPPDDPDLSQGHRPDHNPESDTKRSGIDALRAEEPIVSHQRQ
jgi:hypothetical protein